MKTRLKAILFDMGSTLLEFENSTWDVLGRLCAERSHEFLKQKNSNLPELEEFSCLLRNEFLKARAEVEKNLKEIKFEKVARDFFDILNLSTGDGLYKTFLDIYYRPVTDQVTLIDGAVDILRYFKKRELKIGIVSNTIFPERFHLRELRRFGLYSLLDIHLFSSEVGVRKPHPQIFLQALNALNLEPSQAVFIGDRLIEDVGGAQKAGIKGILKYHEGRDYSAPITPDAQVTGLKELPEVVYDIFENEV